MVYAQYMEFEWDSDKDAANRAKHGISFDEAKHIFDGIVYTVVDDRTELLTTALIIESCGR